MKSIINGLFLLMYLLAFNKSSQAQQNAASDTNRLHMGKVEPYSMTVTYDKTSHLIFPATIRYVDLGSEYLIAGKAEDAQNVLRVKASVRDFTGETNFSVITEDGKFYNFNIVYSAYPQTLNYDMITVDKEAGRGSSNDVLFEELGDSAPSMAALIMETIYSNNKRVIKHIGAKSYGIRLLLKGVYIHDGKYYFHTELSNRSNVPFPIDFINFKIVDKKLAKRTAVQERLLPQLRVYRPLPEIVGHRTERNVFLLDQFTLADDKALLIEFFEKNGGRQQVMQVENADLVHAKRITDMHLNIK